MAGVRRLLPWEERLKAELTKAKEAIKRLAPEPLRRGEDIGRVVLAFEELPRAMDFLRKLLGHPSPYLSGPLPNGTVVLARRLPKAKGRFDRRWEAREGGLWMALAFYDDLLPEVRSWFPILFGLAVTKALQALGAPVALKWVNDVHLAKQKVCGVLIEQAVHQEEVWSLVGLGINVNNDLPPRVPALSLRQILGKELPLEEVFGRVLAEIASFYGLLKEYEAKLLETRYEKGRPPNPLQEAFLALSDTLGERIIFGHNLEKERQIGLAKDISSTGALIIETPRGEIEFLSGEIAYIA